MLVSFANFLTENCANHFIYCFFWRAVHLIAEEFLVNQVSEKMEKLELNWIEQRTFNVIIILCLLLMLNDSPKFIRNLQLYAFKIPMKSFTHSIPVMEHAKNIDENSRNSSFSKIFVCSFICFIELHTLFCKTSDNVISIELSRLLFIKLTYESYKNTAIKWWLPKLRL